MKIEINPHFMDCLIDGINDAPEHAKYVTVEVSSCHMSVFYEYYESLQTIADNLGYELIDPQCYSRIVLVWDLKDKELIFYNNSGLVSDANEYFMAHKDDPKPPPIYTPPSGSNWKNPLEQIDHYCQFDPGEDKCYFCGRPKPEPQKP